MHFDYINCRSTFMATIKSTENWDENCSISMWRKNQNKGNRGKSKIDKNKNTKRILIQSD